MHSSLATWAGERATAARLALSVGPHGTAGGGAAAAGRAFLTEDEIIRIGDHGGEVRIGRAAEVGRRHRRLLKGGRQKYRCRIQ